MRNLGKCVVIGMRKENRTVLIFSIRYESRVDDIKKLRKGQSVEFIILADYSNSGLLENYEPSSRKGQGIINEIQEIGNRNYEELIEVTLEKDGIFLD